MGAQTSGKNVALGVTGSIAAYKACSIVRGLTARGTLMLVAAPAEPIAVSAFSLLSGRKIVGWPSGSAVDSEDTMRFSVLAGVKPRTEVFPLERAEEAFTKVMENRIRFRAVLTP